MLHIGPALQAGVLVVNQHCLTRRDTQWHGMTRHWHAMTCGMTWHGMTRSDTARHDTQWHGTQWRGMTRHGMTCSDTAWHGMAWHAVTRHDTEWHGMMWHGMAWHAVTRHDTEWHGVTRHDMEYVSLVPLRSSILPIHTSRSMLARFASIFDIEYGFFLIWSWTTCPEAKARWYPGMAFGVFLTLSQRTIIQIFFQELWVPVSRRVTTCQWKHRMQDSVSRRVTGGS